MGIRINSTASPSTVHLVVKIAGWRQNQKRKLQMGGWGSLCLSKTFNTCRSYLPISPVMECWGRHYPSQKKKKKKIIKIALQGIVLEERSCLPVYDTVFTGKVHTFLMNCYCHLQGSCSPWTALTLKTDAACCSERFVTYLPYSKLREFSCKDQILQCFRRFVLIIWFRRVIWIWRKYEEYMELFKCF